MDTVFGGLLGTGISTAGNIFSTAMTNRQNENLTREGWAREDNAVQRRAADLSAAGINPLLAAGQAASSSGAIPMKAPEVGDFGASLLSGKQVKTQEDLSKSTKEVNRAHIDNTTAVALAQADNLRSQASLNNAAKMRELWNIGIAAKRNAPTGEAPTRMDAFFKSLETYLGAEANSALRALLLDFGSASAGKGSKLLGGPASSSPSSKYHYLPPQEADPDDPGNMRAGSQPRNEVVPSKSGKRIN